MGLEDQFRVWAFHIYYSRSFRSERDLLLRFVKALEASARPILKPERLAEWARSDARRRDYAGDDFRLFERGFLADGTATVPA